MFAPQYANFEPQPFVYKFALLLLINGLSININVIFLIVFLLKICTF
jgi:hypothetical protein